MIHFFSRKIYLIDLLEGFTDIHNHILPGIDDGAQTVEDSIELISGFSEFGVEKFRMTPHIMHNYYDNNPNIINDSESILKKEISKKSMDSVVITSGAEHMIDSNFEYILQNKTVMPLGEEHLLIEMSYLQPPINFDDAIIAITQNRLFPVLAHPERYNFLLHRTQKYNKFKAQGILFQINMLSLSEHYGKEVHKTAIKLIEENKIDFIGSDVHNINQLNTIKKITLSKKRKKQLIPIIQKTIEVFGL